MNGLGIPGRGIFFIVAIILVVFALAKEKPIPEMPEPELTGFPAVLDGDTIILSRTPIRI